MDIFLKNEFNDQQADREIHLQVGSKNIVRGSQEKFVQKKFEVTLIPTHPQQTDLSAYFIHVDHPHISSVRIIVPKVSTDQEWKLIIKKEVGQVPGATAKLIGEKNCEIKLVYKAGDAAGAADASGNVRIGDSNQ